MIDFDWNKILLDMQKTFKLSEAMTASIRRSPAFKICAAIPFLAGCDDADRFAYSHVATLITAIANPAIATFRESDLETPRRRLSTIAGFSAGDATIIEQGMSLLELAMLLDYLSDLEEDRAGGKANPAETLREGIEHRIEELRNQLTQAPLFDSLFDKGAVEAIEQEPFWRG